MQPKRRRRSRKGQLCLLIALLLAIGYFSFIHPETSAIIGSRRPLLSKTLLLGEYAVTTSARLLWKGARSLWRIGLNGWTRLTGDAPTHDIRSSQELYRLYLQVEQWSGLPWQIFWGLHAEETNLGQNLGRVQVLSVLPESQKRYFLQICRDLHWKPEEVYGSHKGAMGPFQFIPETWVRHAVDGNGDGRKDPFDVEDAAYSAANYLLYKGGRNDLKKALWHYNQDSRYVQRVLRYLRYG